LALAPPEARAQIEALRRSGRATLAEQEPLLQAFEEWSKRFYSLVERGEEATARDLFHQIYPPMKELYELDRSRTEAMVQATIRADGDLEATQQTPEFRDAEIARLRTLYHLNWVSYLGATLLPEAERPPLLRFAVDGFSEFVVGPDPAIAKEALFGRAQAYKGLGEWDEALADLGRLIELGPSFPHYPQARVSKVEVLLGARRPDEAAREASSLLADATAGNLPPTVAVEARLLRAQALFLRLKQGGGGDRHAAVREALSLLREVERAGGSWRSKARAVASWGLEGLPEASAAAGSGFASLAVAQSLMLQGKHAEALAQLEAAIESPATPAEERTASHFQAGVAAFQIERFAVAARHFKAYLEAAPRGADAPEASYLLFKSLEQVARSAPSPQAEQAFRQALQSFVETYPQHPSAAEGRFRLAELLRDEGRVFEAVEEFRRVAGNPTLELYAQFNAAQAIFAWLRDPHVETAAEADRRRAQAIGLLENLLAKLRSPAAAAVPAEDLGAKATIMAAVLAIEGHSPDYRKALELTRDFAKRYPGRPELVRQAFAIEILALQKTADPARAEEALNGYLATFTGSEGARRRLMKRLGREFFVQSEADRAAGRIELAQAGARIAIAIYQRLLSELPQTPETAGARRGTHAMLGQLYAQSGDRVAAVRHYSEVLRIDPRSEEALRGLARLATEMGEHEKAARYWEVLSRVIDPREREWLEARYEAARSALAAGEKETGCRFVRETGRESPYPLVGPDRQRFGDLEKQLCGG
jgi:tetratricopeptide (TPR) repeat protein